MDKKVFSRERGRRMKVLITGSCGFIFSNFIIYAQQETKWDLVSVDKLTHAGSLHNISYNNSVHNKRHKFYLGDVCDYDFISKIFEIEKPDIVIHGAVESMANSHTFVSTNIIGAHSMLEAALKVHMPQKFINISTDEVYGNIKNGQSDEKDILNPRNPYSSSKASADLLGQSYYTAYGLPVITTRCSNNFGPRQHVERFIPKVITNIITNQPIFLYGDGKDKRDWMYVKDKFRALQIIVENGIPGEVYNIGTNKEKENIEVIKTIFDIMGNGEDLLEYAETQVKHDRRHSVNNNKIKNLGWEPTYTFDGALAHTIGWYKANTWFWRK